MRLIWALAAVTLLSGCDPAGAPRSGGHEMRDSGADVARYDFRLPAGRIRPVLRSNADGCEALGPARCRVADTRYRVDSDNRVAAELALRIDPDVARRFGEAIGEVVVDAGGVLESGALAVNATSPARDRAMLGRLRNALRDAEASGTAEARRRAPRIREALATIAEVEARQGQTLADAPMLIRYRSTNALPGPTLAERRLRGLGGTLRDATADLLQMLARLTPWLLLMALVALVLRWIVRDMPVGRGPHDVVYSAPPPKDPPWPPRIRKNPMHGWFSREGERGRD